MEQHTKCSCDNTPSNCTSCFEIRLCLNRMWHSIYISQTIKQKGKTKNKITKNEGNRLIFLFGKELRTPPPTPIIHTCMFNKMDKNLFLMNQKITPAAIAQGHIRSGSDNLLLLYRKKWPVFLSALPPVAMLSLDSHARETTHSHCVAYKVTRLSLGAYRCKYFCIWSCKWNTKTQQDNQHLHHTPQSQEKSRHITNTLPEPFLCHSAGASCLFFH